MTVDAWVTLWSALLWVSACAFAVLAVYIAVGYARQLMRD